MQVTKNDIVVIATTMFKKIEGLEELWVLFCAGFDCDIYISCMKWLLKEMTIHAKYFHCFMFSLV